QVERTSRDRTRFVASKSGRVLVQVNHGPHGTMPFKPVEYCASAIQARDHQGMGRPWRFGGFWLENLTFHPAAQAPIPYTDVIVPLYAVAALLLPLPAIWLYRLVKSRRARRLNLCPTCAY